MAYLAGLALVQGAIALAAVAGTRRWRASAPEALGRAQGALAVAAGAMGAWVLAVGPIG